MLKEKNKKKTWERVDTKSLISGARVFLKAKDSSYLGKLGQRTAKDALGTLLQETYNYMVTIMAIEEENKRLKRENEQILAEKEKAEEEREEFRAQNIASDARILELENKLLHKGGI
jgi:Ser-tRNA(Ala) deacylase AlaX